MKRRMTVDTQSIIKKYPNVHEINEVMGIWEIDIDGCPVTLKIKVVKHSRRSECLYTGTPNRTIQNPNQMNPYANLYKYYSTVEGALDDVLDGFYRYFKPELADKTKFDLVKDW